MNRGQRALLKFWRSEGIAKPGPPPKLVDADGKQLTPRTWKAFFETMDAFNLMAFHFKLDNVFIIR